MTLYISPETAQQVRKQFDGGRSHRQIARQLRLSPTTVARIIAGRWHPADENEDPDWQLKAQARRCLSCGKLIYRWPCLACDLQAKHERHLLLRKCA